MLPQTVLTGRPNERDREQIREIYRGRDSDVTQPYWESESESYVKKTEKRNNCFLHAIV